MKENDFKQVEGELTDSIVEDLKLNSRECLYVISLQPCLEDELTDAEAFFIINNRHLDFFNPTCAREMAGKYNFLQIEKASPEQLSGVSRKILIPREAKKNLEDRPALVAVSRYFFSTINKTVENERYTSSIKPQDEIYLKFLQALHPTFNNLASLNAETYNIVQKRAREKCRSSAKLKQISKIGTKLGYGICLE